MNRLLRPGALGLALVAASLSVIGLGSTALAQDNFWTDDLSYSGFAASSVACDPATGQITVTATAETMTAQGLLGRTVGPYDAGQSVRYDVLVQELGATEWQLVYDWSPWVTIVGQQDIGGGAVIKTPQTIGTAVVSAQPGTDVLVQVNIDFWIGREFPVQSAVTYTQTYSTDAYNTYDLHPGMCHM